MQLLDAIVGPEPVIVFCGMAGAESTKPRDHYYASPGNNFWECLHQSGLTPRQLRPDQDQLVVDHGLALTDLVGHWDHETGRGWVEIERLVADVERWQPAFVAFTPRAPPHTPRGHWVTGLPDSESRPGESGGRRSSSSRAPAGPTAAATMTAVRIGSPGGATWRSCRPGAHCSVTTEALRSPRCGA